MDLFTDSFNILDAIHKTAECGYVFISSAINQYYLSLLEKEINSLDLEEGDHINYPINANSKRSVKQFHIRSYMPIGHDDCSAATLVTNLLTDNVKEHINTYPSLSNWKPTEAGYQCYRDSKDWISPHRDRRNDQLLSATITISGSANVRIFEPLGDPDDYSNLKQTDEFLTKTGTIMFLRAPGFGNGEQSIHEVMPPINGKRLILNLRMRPNILRAPKYYNPK